MNHIFRTIWNAARGQLVVVNEATASHSQSGGSATTVGTQGTVAESIVTAFRRSGIAVATAAALSFCSATAFSAHINTSTWATETDVISDASATVSANIDATGGTFGPVYGFAGWDAYNKMLVTVGAGYTISQGVYQNGADNFGELGVDGRTHHWGMLNSGTIEDQMTLTGRTDGKTQNIGSTNWIERFANLATGKLSVYDLRSTQVLNASTNFNVTALHIREGGILENVLGAQMTVGDLRVGVADASIFNNFVVTLNEEGNAIALPGVTMSTNNSTMLYNDGTLNAGRANVAGTLINTGTFRTTNTAGGTSAFNAVTNTRKMELASDADFGTLDLQSTTATLASTSNLTVGTSLHNSGKIGTSAARINTLTSQGTAENVGSLTEKAEIYAQNASFATLRNGAVNDSGTLGGLVDVSGTLSSTGTVENAGQIIAGILSTADFTNSGTVTVNGSSLSTVASLTNSGTFAAKDLTVTNAVTNTSNLSVNAGTFASLANGSDSGSRVAGTLTAAGLLTVTGNTTNVGDINAAQVTLGRFTNTTGSTLSLTGNDASTINTLENAGTVNFDGAAHTGTAEVSVQTIASNTGTINAYKLIVTGESEENDDLSNRGTIAVTDRLTASGTVNNAAGRMSAGAFTLGKVTNDAVMTQTSTTLTSAIDKLYNGGTLNLKHATTVGSLSNTNTGTQGRVLGAADLKVSYYLQNAGQLGAADERLTKLTVNGSAENTGSIYAAAADFQGLTNNNAVNVAGAMTVGGTLANNSGSIVAGSLAINGDGDNVNSATITATNGVTATKSFSSTDTLETGTGLTVKNGAKATLAGTATGTTLRLEASEASIESAGAAFTNLSTTGAATLSNKVDLVFNSISAEAGLTYNQTAGSLRTTDGSFFSNATLNISGGTLDARNFTTRDLGTGNTVNISKNGGQVITGSGNPPQLSSDWRSSYTYVHVGELNSNSTVNVAAGGVLEADSINLTSQTVRMQGGALASTLSAFFKTVTEAVYEIDSGDEHHLTSSILGANDVDKVNESVTGNIAWTAAGGTFVVTDDYVSRAAIRKAAEKLAQAAGAAGGSNTYVVYTGALSDTGSASNIVYNDTFLDIQNEQEALPGSKFVTPGVVFASMVYDNRQNDSDPTAKANLVVGATGTSVTDGWLLDQSIGFRKVTGAESINVQDGKIFTLTGSAASEDELVGSSNGAVAVKGASLFNLGSLGVVNTKGHVGSITVEEGGAFKAVQGTYRVDDLNLTRGNATVLGTATLTVADYADTADGVLVNEGNLTLTSAPTLLGTVTNRKTLAVSSDVSVQNTFANAETGTVDFAKAVTLKVGIDNAKGGVIKIADGLTVESGVAAADSISYGRIVSTGPNTFKGGLTIGRDAQGNAGTFLAQGANTVEGGTLSVKGDVLLGSLTASTGRIEVGQNALLYVEGDGGIRTGLSGRFTAGAGSIIAAKTLNLLGVSSINSGASLKIGTRPMESVNAARLNAIKGEDYVVPTSAQAANLMAAAAPMSLRAVDLPTRDYDINNMRFTSTMPGITYTSDQALSGNAVVDNVRISGALRMSNSSQLQLTNNVFILAGNSLTIDGGSNLDAQDWHRNASETWQTNLIMKGTGVMNGTSSISNLVLADGGTWTVSGTDNNVRPVDGSLLTILGGTYSVTDAGVANWDIATVKEGGTITSAGDFNVGTLENAGSVTLATVSNFGADKTYIQTGNGQLTITNRAWFNGTNIVYEGGAIVERTDLGADGTLGANKVTIKREGYAPDITRGDPNTATFDGLTTVHVTTLTNATDLAVKEGGRIIIDALSGSANALVDGGVLDIALGDVTTTSSSIDGILIGAGSPTGIGSVNSGVISNPNGITFDGTKLAGFTFNNAVVNLRSGSANTWATLSDVTRGLTYFGSATAIYNGTVAGAVENAFSVAQIQNFIAEQQSAGSVAANPGLVLSQYSLKVTSGDTVNWTSDTSAVNALTGSIGFADIIGAQSISVDDGLTASLTGTALAGTDFDWSDNNRLLKSSTSSVGGTVTVKTTGRMVFGSNGTAQANTGWVDLLESNGNTEISNFVLGAKAANFTGTTTVKSNARLLVGTVADTETSEIGGIFRNQGSLDMSAVETVSVTGKLTNEAEAKFSDMTVTAGSEVSNSGHEEGGHLTVAAGAVHTNIGTSDWQEVDILVGGKSVIGSDAAAESFAISGVYTNAGTVDASKAEAVTLSGRLVNSGTALWDGLDVTAGSEINVTEGIMAVGGMTAEEVRAVTDKSAVLALGRSLDVSGSKLTVGMVASGDTVGSVDVYFGADSALVLDTVSLTGDKAISGSGKVTVKDGSNLVVTNASWGRHVVVTDGLNTEQTDDGAWQGGNLVNRTDKELAVEIKDTQIILKAGANPDDPVDPPPVDPTDPDEPVVPPVNPDGPATDICSLSGDYLAPDVINGLIDTDEGAAIRDVNSPHADVAIIDRMLEKAYAGETADGRLDVARSVKVLNSVIGFNGATGADAYNMSRVTDRMGRVEAHAQELRGLESGLWIDFIGEVDRTDGLKMGGRDSGYKADAFGFIAGGDVSVGNDFRIGGAFTYVRGDLDSKGGYLPVSTDTDTLGLTVYGVKDMNDLRISAHIGYDWTDADSTMNFGDAAGNGYKVTGELGMHTFSAGVRADYAFRMNGFDVVPHAGIRWAHTRYDDYTVKLNGQSAFRNNPDSTDLVQVPVGVTVKGSCVASGWTIRPSVDLTIIPQFGDTDHDVSVSAVNYVGTDSYSHGMAGDFVGKFTLGLDATKNSMTYGISYSGAAGDEGRMSHALKASVNWQFR